MLNSGFGIPLGNARNRAKQGPDGSPPKCIWIPQEELTPNNLEVVEEVLRAEGAPIKYWLLLAFSYKALGHLESFDSILKEAEGAFADGEEPSYDKGCLFSSLAFHNLGQAFQFKNDKERHAKYMDWTNHYARKAEAKSPYHFYLVRGHNELLNFTRDKNTDHLSAARNMFNAAIAANPTALIPYVQFGNVLAMNANYQMAAVYYVRSLIMASYYLSIVERTPAAASTDPQRMFEVTLVRAQLTALKALLLFGVAACQFAMGNVDKAKATIEESIAVKPLPVAYRLCSAITAYQMTHFREGPEDVDLTGLLRDYTSSCLASHMLERNNYTSRLQLCELLFHRGELEECERRLADLQKLNLPYNLKPELEYQLGRLHHHRGNYSEAMANYVNALALKNDFMTARLQLVKVAVGCGDLGLAREHCDFLLQCLQKVPVVLKVAAYVYLCSARETLEGNRWEMLRLQSANRHQTQLDISCMFHTVQQGMGRLIDERLFKAVSLLEDFLFPAATADAGEGAEEFPAPSARDARGAEGLDRDNTDPEALEYYIRALEILVSRGREYLCPKLKTHYCEHAKMFGSSTPEFLNNFGVILMYTRNYARACEVLGQLSRELAERDAQGADFALKTLALTVRFNHALALEFSGQVSRAHKAYSALTAEYPRYTAAWLRKSVIAFRKVGGAHAQSDHENCVRYLDQVKKIHPLSFEPYLMRAYQLGAQKAFDEAIQELRKMFRSVPASTYDPYANTLLASLMIRQSYRVSQATGAPTAFPKEAMQHAKAALKRPAVCNFYAANCIAVILAVERKLKPAYESFLLLLESLSVTSHMKLLVNKNMGILSAAVTLAALSTDKKLDKNKLNKLKVAKTQQHFQSAIANGKMDRSLYTSYIRFLFDVQKFEECISAIETARLMFHDDRLVYNQVIATDAMVCSYLRDADKTNSVVEMTNMLAACGFITASADHLIALNQRGHAVVSAECCNKLRQIMARVKAKVIPHIQATLPQLEKSCENKQKAREKRLQLQLSIQQAQEAKKRQLEQERARAKEAEEALSQQLLREASEIASELLTTKPSQA